MQFSYKDPDVEITVTETAPTSKVNEIGMFANHTLKFVGKLQGEPDRSSTVEGLCEIEAFDEVCNMLHSYKRVVVERNLMRLMETMEGEKAGD